MQAWKIGQFTTCHITPFQFTSLFCFLLQYTTSFLYLSVLKRRTRQNPLIGIYWSAGSVFVCQSLGEN